VERGFYCDKKKMSPSFRNPGPPKAKAKSPLYKSGEILGINRKSPLFLGGFRGIS
jgi:hypothetical protein